MNNSNHYLNLNPKFKLNHYLKLDYRTHAFHIKDLEHTDIFIPSLKITNKYDISSQDIDKNPELIEYTTLINNSTYFYKDLAIFKSSKHKNIILNFGFNPILLEDTNEIVFKTIDYILNNNIGKYIHTNFGAYTAWNNYWICTFEVIDKELLLQLI